jgi:hypothetical protein
MSESNRKAGESQILEIAGRVAKDFAKSCNAEIRIIGWIGSTGQQGHEFAVNVDGKGFNFEVGESQVLGISSDETIQQEVEERIRQQMSYAVANIPPAPQS